MDHRNLSVVEVEQQRASSSSLTVRPLADCHIKHRHLNQKFAQLDLETLRYLFPNNSYAATCRVSEIGRRCKTPTLERLWSEMNDGKKVLVNVVMSEIDYLVPAKLICERSAWFAEQLHEYEWFDSVVFAMATADMFESVIKFMCTGTLRILSDEGNELERLLEVCILACKLKMEELEWCAVGKLEEYFETNKNTHLPRATIQYVLHNTSCTSHLREWLTDHVAGCLNTGAMCAEALEGVIATAPGLATKIISSMQRTVVEITNALLDMNLSEIRKARCEVMRGSRYDGYPTMDNERDEDMDDEEIEDVDGMDEDEDNERDKDMDDEADADDENLEHSNESSGDEC